MIPVVPEPVTAGPGDPDPSRGDGLSSSVAVTMLLGSPVRLAAARRTEVLARTAGSLDDLAGHAARLLGTAAAQVSVLTDEQVITAGAGTARPTVGTTNALDDVLCTLTAAHGGPLSLPDAGQDGRAADLTPVSSGAVASYLGVPLLDGGGEVVGSVCVFDAGRREWTEDDVATLQLIARAVTAELELSAADLTAETGQPTWARAVDAGEVGRFDWEPTEGRVGLDDRVRALLGTTGAEPDGFRSALLARVHDEDRGRLSRVLDSAFDPASGSSGRISVEFRVSAPGSAMRWVHARGRVLHDDEGNAIRLLGILLDTTDVHAEQSRTSRLVEAMPSGFLSMDRDWRVRYLNAAAERLLGRTRDLLAGRTVWAAFPDLEGSEFEAGCRLAVATGEARTLDIHLPEPLGAWFEVLCWPTPDGLSLYFSDVSERKLAAERAARASARLRLLAGVTQDLLAPEVPAAVAGLARMLVPALADGCMVTLLQADGRPEDVGAWHADPGQRQALKRYVQTRLRAMPLGSPVARVLAGAGEVRSSTAEVTELLPEGTTRAVLQEFDATHAVVLPVRGKNRVLGALSLFSGAGRPLDPDDVTTARDIAARAGHALETDRFTRTQARLAAELQRSLLTEPPEPDHAHIVVRYVPASESARVGGDWYDAFMQAGGATMLVIGDVVGHDVQAAAAMGRLHGLLRGIATATDAGPAEVLSSLDRAMELLQVQPLATALIARLEQTPEEFDRGVTRLAWANAGHPPLLVVHPDGRQQFLDSHPAELLLGVDPTTARTEQVVEVERGSTVLLYTDGLVERRTSDLDEGQRRLSEVVAEIVDQPLEDLCDALIDHMVDGRPDDDVALVAARLHRQDRPRPAEAGPNEVPPPLRRPGHG